VIEWPTYRPMPMHAALERRFPDDEAADDDLWSIWLHNDGDVLSQQVHQEALALGRAYMLVSPGDDDEFPLITAESPFDAIHEDDPRTRDVAFGLKQYTDADGTQFATLYYPEGRTAWYREKRGGGWQLDAGLSAENDVDLCALVPYVNQPRFLGRLRPGRADVRLGRSEFHDIIPIVDAINKMGTDMMVSGEFHAMPRRWAFGLKAEDFEDENGNPVAQWSMIASRLWANEDKDIKVGQFQEADLGNFRETLKLLMQVAAQKLALPAYYNAFETANPPNGDSIKASEVQLVKRTERKQTGFGNRHSRVQRLVTAVKYGVDDAQARKIETLWRDPATPTISQKADATVKLVQARDGRGRSIVPVEQAREDLGYTAEQRKRMAEMDADADDPQVTAALRALQTAGAAPDAA
jgi:hypothetical protein